MYDYDQLKGPASGKLGVIVIVRIIRCLEAPQSWKRVAGTRGAPRVPAGRVEILKIAGTRYPRGETFDPARVARVGFPDIAGSKK